ncbi:MAG: hypothetical protein C0467_19485 [Planctomycetaceae bacterium]|nr:hypothetical protein [Planctomycetaceae bacterium]
MRIGRVEDTERKRHGEKEQDADVFSPLFRVSHSTALIFAAIAFLVLPIFAHGCHRGDHDDEPLFVPVEHRATSVDVAR